MVDEAAAGVGFNGRMSESRTSDLMNTDWVKVTVIILQSWFGQTNLDFNLGWNKSTNAKLCWARCFHQALKAVSWSLFIDIIVPIWIDHLEVVFEEGKTFPQTIYLLLEIDRRAEFVSVDHKKKYVVLYDFRRDNVKDLSNNG
jgi:hypothetical protein